MHQIKIFKGLENDIGNLEAEVNRWLAQSKVGVIQMFGNLAPQSTSAGSARSGLSGAAIPPSDVLLIVLYDELSHMA
jgi:hypothetical protein